MDETEEIYLTYFKTTFDALGLERYATSLNPKHGSGLIEFRNNSFRLQLLNDRGLFEITISPLFGQNQFLGIEFYSSFLRFKNSMGKMSGSEKNIIRGTRLDFNSQARFLIDNLDILAELLSKKNYKTTLREINTYLAS